MIDQSRGDTFGHAGEASEHAYVTVPFVGVPFSFGRHRPWPRGHATRPIPHLWHEQFQQGCGLKYIPCPVNDKAFAAHRRVHHGSPEAVAGERAFPNISLDDDNHAPPTLTLANLLILQMGNISKHFRIQF